MRGRVDTVGCAPFPDGTSWANAVISVCGLYRYRLDRIWERDKKLMIVVGLNPSTADAEHDDPTVRRLISFAKREFCGGLVVLNLFAYRATDPTMLDVPEIDPVGPENDVYLAQAAERAEGNIFVLAWGARGAKHGYGTWVRDLLLANGCSRLWHFGLTKDGQPKHPLYLSARTPLVAS